jgi:hypothetical protein
MKRFLAALLLLAAPLLGQAPTKYSLATQVGPGFSVNLFGDTYYALNPTTFQRIAGNTTAVKNFWCQTGTGSVSAAPVWCLLASSDIPSLAASIITSGTIATARLGSGTANSTTFLRGDQTYATPTGSGGGAPVGLVQIAQIVTSGSQATVDFTSIGSGYTDLRVVFQARSNLVGSFETIYLKVNNDGTSGNYTAGHYVGGNTTSTYAGTNASTSSGISIAALGGTTSPSNFAAVGEVVIPNYAGTTFYKGIFSTARHDRASDVFSEIHSGHWSSTAAITRLTFSVPTSFVNGSTFTLYGTVTGGLSTVVLQPTTPGTAQTGNSNITGTSIAGGFSGPLTGNVTGNTSGSAATLATPRAINGVAFDGSAPITVTADANTLTGTMLHSTVVNSSLTSVGTLTNLTVTSYIDASLATIANGAFSIGYNTHYLSGWKNIDAAQSGQFFRADATSMVLYSATTGSSPTITAVGGWTHGAFGIGTGTGTPTAKLQVVGLVDYANNTAATAAGLTAGAFYTVTGSNPKQVAIVY